MCQYLGFQYPLPKYKSVYRYTLQNRIVVIPMGMSSHPECYCVTRRDQGDLQLIIYIQTASVYQCLLVCNKLIPQMASAIFCIITNIIYYLYSRNQFRTQNRLMTKILLISTIYTKHLFTVCVYEILVGPEVGIWAQVSS